MGLSVDFLRSTTKSQKSEHVIRSGMSRATTQLLGPRASDATCGRQVFLHFPTHVNRLYPVCISWFLPKSCVQLLALVRCRGDGAKFLVSRRVGGDGRPRHFGVWVPYLERIGRSVPPDGHRGEVSSPQAAGWVGRSVHSDWHSHRLGLGPES